MGWEGEAVLDHARALLGQGTATFVAVPPEEVIALFRDAFLEIRRLYKAAYVREVVSRHTLSHRDLGRILGYESPGAVNGAMEGRIAEDRFAFLRATLARQVRNVPRWPSPEEFASLALLQTMTQLGERLGLSGEPISPEEHEILRRVLCPEWMLALAGMSPKCVQTCLEDMLNDVHVMTGTSRVRTKDDIASVLARWGRLYLFCKSTIPGLCGPGGQP